MHVYKGFAGAVRDLIVHPKQPLVFSVSLDRFLRVHSLTSRKLVFKVCVSLLMYTDVAGMMKLGILSTINCISSFCPQQEYLKSRLNCLLVRENLEEMDFTTTVNNSTSKRKVPVQESKPERKTKVVKRNTEVTEAEWESLTV